MSQKKRLTDGESGQKEVGWWKGVGQCRASRRVGSPGGRLTGKGCWLVETFAAGKIDREGGVD